MGAGGQLAVGEGACAPLAELDVGGRIEHAGGPEPLHVGGPLLHRAAPLQHDGGNAAAGQVEGGEEPGGAHAHHHRRQGGGAAHRREGIGGVLVERDVFIPAAGHDPGLVGHGHVYGTDIVDVALLPGVDGLPGQREPGDSVRLYAQDAGGLLFQLRLTAADGQRDILNSNHSTSVWKRPDTGRTQ